MTRTRLPVESVKSTLRVAVARGIAAALVCGFDECDEREHGRGRGPAVALTQVQRIALVEMGLMAYADAVREGEATIEAEGDLFGAVERIGEAARRES